MTSGREFRETIDAILARRFGAGRAREIVEGSPLVGYLERKTRAANRGSKSRGSFANLYAVYVLVEDYLAGGFAHRPGSYRDYEGARFTGLMKRQRELPFGQNLQNHALNSRLNDEFHKYYPDVAARPIQRDVSTQRYWLNESLLIFNGLNLGEAVIEVVDEYVRSRRDSFTEFAGAMRRIAELDAAHAQEKEDYITSLLRPSTDARIFEITAFAIMKAHYGARTVWFGPSRDEIEETSLLLYKTGRTNANDGGIDFVMRPLGRFFQVTETLDLKKYFLDIDKVQRFPITFVVKTELSVAEITSRLRSGAEQTFGVARVVESYMAAIEEVVNIPRLKEYLVESARTDSFSELVDEIILQSNVEFNLDEDEEAMSSAVPDDG